MALKIGYLLPTREQIMEGRPEAAPMLALSEKAEGLGYDSLWIGDSVLARPRHDPLTLMAAVSARTKNVNVGTAVLLPALRNPVILAHQIATVDQISEGRIILGMGIAADVPNIHAEFEACGVPWDKRVGRFLEGIRLCRAFWSGGERLREVRRMAVEEGRKAEDITAAAYLTLAIDENEAKANERIDTYLSNYYGARPDVLKKRQACFGGSAEGAIEWLQGYVNEGARHIVLRFAGDHDRNLEALAKLRDKISV
jgi:alkanesulfonate monooxygenase SsuD/methylene tetrahydromethanopterin reductase-like flavin-dependent oxidoreductase (luciferase family)